MRRWCPASRTESQTTRIDMSVWLVTGVLRGHATQCLGNVGSARARRASTERCRLNPSMDSPILIDVWTVEPPQQGELAQGIADGVRNVMVGRQGFVSAQLYESTSGDAMMVMVRMRTIKERQELTDSPEAHSLMRELRAIARSHVRLFQLVENFGEVDEPR
jgi:hypothetical protein